MGNIMKWKGIKRETAPFVLTPEFAYVMGGEQSETFKEFSLVCCKAFNILRKKANLFITLFLLVRKFCLFLNLLIDFFCFVDATHWNSAIK